MSEWDYGDDGSGSASGEMGKGSGEAAYIPYRRDQP